MVRITRREALRTLGATAAGLPFFARLSDAEVANRGRDVNARLAGPAAYRRRTLTEHQNATVTAMAEIIIPETDTPGAAAVRVNDFMDVILTDWFDAAETDLFLAGLDLIDRRTNADYAGDFIACTAPQQQTVIAALDADLVRTVEAGQPVAGLFFYQFKRLTLTGYYTSEAGMTEELQWQVIPGAYRACEPVENLRRG